MDRIGGRRRADRRGARGRGTRPLPDRAAEAVRESGAEVVRGSIEDLDGLRDAAGAADGVIHTAYHHDFSEMDKAAELDRQAIEALASAVAGSERPLVVTTGVALVAPGHLATETDISSLSTHPRVATEAAARELASHGVRLSIVRPAPTVHGPGDHRVRRPAARSTAALRARPAPRRRRWSRRADVWRAS